MNNREKTSFVFMQGGNNSRIGNTLVWLESAYTWCEKNDFEFLFPQKDQVFNGIFDQQGKVFSESCMRFGDSGVEALSIVLNGLPQKIAKHTREVESNIFTCELIPRRILFVDFRGREWCPSEELVKYFRSFDIVVLNEPFPFLTGEREFGLLKFSSQADKYCKKLNTQFRNNLISVHIRQGDYKNWNNGKYYRNDEFYNVLIRNLSQEFPSHSVRFMHNGEFTPENDNRCFAMNYDKEDQLTPELSDFLAFTISSVIIGPISTFTAQAKLLGKSQLGIESKILQIEPDDDVCSIIKKVQGFLR